MCLVLEFIDSRLRSILAVTFFALILASCAGPGRLGGGPDVQVVSASELPAPTRADLLTGERPYLVGPFDRLVIDVFGIEELSKLEVQIDASGRISFPLVGIIEVAGQTPGEIEGIIAARLRDRYVRDPQVTVNLKETVSQVVTVDGQVKQPGLYPVIGRMTLMRAIATARGVDEYAKLDDVVIFRNVEGQSLAALYNLGAIRRGQYTDPEVFANDIVIVGDSPSRRIFQFALQALPAITTPIILLLQNN